MTAFDAGLLYSGLAAGADLLGGSLVTAKGRWDARFLNGTLALGCGFMLAATLLDIIPAGLNARGHGLPLLVLAGYLLVMAAQRAAGPCATPDGHAEDYHGHDHPHRHREQPGSLPTQAAISAVIGLLVHTFFDGVAIGAAFQVTASLGLLVFLAVIFHKLPEGLALASIVLSAGGSRSQALGAVGLIGLATVVGTVLTNTLTLHYGHYALAVSGGVMLYVTASDLVPQVTRTPGSWPIFLMLSGVGIYAASNHMLHLARLP
jgi:ZIP family zinc transporter/zinc and cadmium transporter